MRKLVKNKLMRPSARGARDVRRMHTDTQDLLKVTP